MFRAFDRRAKTAPSRYPRIPFHALRFVQLISSLVVGGIMLFFIWHLTHDHWSTPWTFMLLTAASLFSIAALAFTIILHCCTGLHPRINMLVNALLALLWALSWALLTWYLTPTLSHMCDIEHWTEEVGIMVCRIYKVLFSFTLFGLLSTFAALFLDVYVHRQQAHRGHYRLQDIDLKQPAASRGPWSDAGRGYGAGGLSEPRESEAWEAPRESTAPFGESASVGLQRQGYAVPEHQFDYDTGYGGPAAVYEHEQGKPYGQM